MVPESALPALLEYFFPVIEGPHDLPGVRELVDARGVEFCASPRLDAQMVARVCRAGFLPMSEEFTGHEILLVKVHEQRCLLDPEELHIAKSTRRHARGVEISIDTDFDRCLDAIVAHHPDRWLTERLNGALRELYEKPREGVAAHSVEVYDGSRLVAGEIGYACGRVYTSLSGFHAKSGAGSVQLASLGVLLRRAGFAWWDLGMVIEYKLALGARVFGREEFLRRYALAADERTPLLAGRTSCEPLVRPAYSSTG